MSYRNTITFLVIATAMMAFASGCRSSKKMSGGNTVRVVDGLSGKPISGASVVVIHPAGAGRPFKTDRLGIAHISGGFGPKEDGIHIQASVPHGPTTSIGLSGVTTNYVEIKMGSFTNATRPRENAVLWLNNHGGLTHAGRTIALRAGGSYTDTTYTDAGVGPVKSGRYTWNLERTRLALLPKGGKLENLYQVDYGDQQYWVREDERQRITEAGEASLRRISLRVVP